MEGGTRSKAAEMVVEECVAEGEVCETLEAVAQASRELTAEEGRLLFENGLSQKKLWAAIGAVRHIALTEKEKDRLVTACWPTRFVLEALEVTGRTMSEKDFHRLVKRAVDNWEAEEFVIALAQKTGYRLNDSEKKDFLNLMVKSQRKDYDSSRLQKGLDFLGDWLPPEGAHRLFAVLEGYRYPDIAFNSMMNLAVIAKGKVIKESILKQAALAINRVELEKIEETVRQATGETLTLDDYHFLFLAAMRDENYYARAAQVIATKYPRAIKEQEFNEFINRSMRKWDLEEAAAVMKAANEVGKLSLETLKGVILKLWEGPRSISRRVIQRIEIYDLALERGINFTELKEQKNAVKKTV